MKLEESKLEGFDKKFAEETIKALQELIRINTTNPPGNEVKAAEWIHDYLTKEGIESVVVESEKGRGSVISRFIKGNDNNSPSLLLLAHLDVVPSQDLDKWDVPPFSGEFKDNFIWGRGALDCKGTVISQMMTYIKLHRDGFKPKGEIYFAATADEESGGHKGPGWLLKNKPDLIKADHVITEGGGQLLPFPSPHPNFIIQVAEKGVFWTKMKVNGEAGHGSMPGNKNNMAIMKMTKIINKILKRKPKIIMQDLYKEAVNAMELKGYYKFFLKSKLLFNFAMYFAQKMLNEDVGKALRPLVQNTITPTVIQAGNKVNNIPGTCISNLDVRFLPGYDRTHLEKTLKKCLGRKLYNEIEFEPIIDQPGGYTPTETQFYQQIYQVMQKMEPGSVLVPFISAGSTDMAHIRKPNYGMKAYGFVPMKIDEGLSISEIMEMAHGYNERISYGNLMFATKFHYELCLMN
ncbi:MAG: M20/M25/M40 family metallo-hydrolase [Candidatus Lokiarchaeota archaeon]|nr:M20/M25/M40 family metallo-hydrolase [Candidatus Lokiarchaeota archaeon]